MRACLHVIVLLSFLATPSGILPGSVTTGVCDKIGSGFGVDCNHTGREAPLEDRGCEEDESEDEIAYDLGAGSQSLWVWSAASWLESALPRSLALPAPHRPPIA